jgi:hypothetical protein
MANAPHLFEDLHLIDNAGEVNGIGAGMQSREKGRSSFHSRMTTDEFIPSDSQTASTYLV